jgi:hypothetical protein
VTRPSGGHQGLRDVSHRVDGTEQHQGLVAAVAVPVDLALGDVDHGELALGARGQWHAGVGGDTGHRRHPGHDVEGDARLDAGEGLLRPGGIQPRVAGHQAYDVLGALRVLDDELRARRVRQRLAVLAVAAVHHAALEVRAHPREQLTVLLGLGDDHVRAADQVDRSQREQRGVARAGADEGHEAGRAPRLLR